MRRLLGLALLGLGAYCVFLIVLFPAGQALALALPQLEGQGIVVSAREVNGSAWNGRIEAVSINDIALERLRWRLTPLALLRGRAGGRWSAALGDGRLEGHGSADLDGSTRVEQVQGRVPVAFLAGQLPLPVTVGGSLSVDLERIEWDAGQPVAGEGVVVWSGAKVTAPAEVELGDLRLTLSRREQGGIVGTVTDGGGPLEIDGRIDLAPPGDYRIEARVAARPGADATLAQTLPMLGRQAPDGKYLITFNGRI